MADAIQQVGVGATTVTPAAVAVVVAPTLVLGALGAIFAKKHRLVGAVVGAAVGAVGTAIYINMGKTS